MPSLFVGHGAPLLALDAEKGAPLRQWGRQLPSPRAILVVSAHWEHSPVTIGTTRRQRLLYDFYGFPPELYKVQYAAPGAPALADRVEQLLAGDGVVRDEQRPLDHGVWTPLVHLFPEANVPVLQISLDSGAGGRHVFEIGQRLAPLRDEDILLLGSGNITHNLRRLGADGAAPPPFARAFDAWVTTSLVEGDVDALLDYRRRAPMLAENHPTEEHWLPLLFTLGTRDAGTDRVSFPVEGFEFSSLSRRAVQLAPAP